MINVNTNIDILQTVEISDLVTGEKLNPKSNNFSEIALNSIIEGYDRSNTIFSFDNLRKYFQKYDPFHYKIENKVAPDRFVALQTWQCIVIKVYKDTFLARVVNLYDENIEDEEVEFFSEDLYDDDLELLEPGAIFYWTVGHLIKRSGQKIRGHVIKFKRMPKWTSEELEDAKMQAKKIKETLRFE